MVRNAQARTAALVGGLFALAGALVACSAILGLPDDVTTIDPDAGSEAAVDATSDSEEASGPMDCPAQARAAMADTDLTYVFGAGACQVCLQTNCAAASTSCAKDPSCRARLSCLSCCADSTRSATSYFSPACYDRCVLAFPEDDDSDTLDKKFLSTCGAVCRSECALGADFSCVQKYRWPSPTQSPLTIELRIVYAQDLDHGAVASGSVSPCSQNLGQWPCPDITDASAISDGNVSFAVETTEPTSGRFVPWYGYLVVHGPGLSDAGTLLYRNRPEYLSRPLHVGDFPERFPVPFATDVSNAYFVTGESAPVDAGTVIGAVEDCRTLLGLWADGIVVSIEGSPIKAYYLQGITPAQTEATGADGTFIFLNAPPGRQKFVFKQLDGGATVSEVEMMVLPQKLTQIGAWPSSAP